MGRSKTQVKRRSGRGKSVQVGDMRATAGSGPDRYDGRKRPDTPTTSPVTPADPVARVIKTRS